MGLLHHGVIIESMSINDILIFMGVEEMVYNDFWIIIGMMKERVYG